MTSSGSISKSAERVCVVCGSSLINRRSEARHCSAACRVEASRIRGILSGTYSGPYRSVKERLEAAQKAYKDALVTNVTSDGGSLSSDTPSARETAVGKLVSRTRSAA
jgi:hypothetical protein